MAGSLHEFREQCGECAIAANADLIAWVSKLSLASGILMSVRGAVLLVIGVTIGMPAWSQNAASRKPTLVEFWHVGDYGLSQHIAIAVESAIAGTPEFLTSTGRKPGTLIVLVPSNIVPKKVGGRTEAHFRVEYSWTDRQEKQTRAGSCWEDELSVCVRQILDGARAMTQKAH